MTNADGALELTKVSKSFGSQPVLQSLSLSLHLGERVLLLGANGAGKSTLLRIIAGLTTPDSGRIVTHAAGRVSLCSHHLFLYPRLTVSENLSLFGALVGCKSSLKELLALWDLEKFHAAPVANLSKGNQARVALARAFLAPTPVLLLDEPTSNLDERGTNAVRTAIEASRDAEGRKSLVVLATHDLHRMEEIASRVVVISHGRVLADSGPWCAQAELSRVISQYRETNR
jgi:ABC-type multidrug transport system ATPase subunit